MVYYCHWKTPRRSWYALVAPTTSRKGLDSVDPIRRPCQRDPRAPARLAFDRAEQFFVRRDGDEACAGGHRPPVRDPEKQHRDACRRRSAAFTPLSSSLSAYSALSYCTSMIFLT